MLTEGRGPEADDEIALDFNSADGLGVELGDEVTIATTQQGTETYTLVGILGLGEDGDGVLGRPPDVLHHRRPPCGWPTSPTQFNFIAVAAEPGVTQAELADGIAGRASPASRC